MDQNYIISIVERSGVPFAPEPTIQKEFHFVRFFHQATDRSLNLGYRSTKAVSWLTSCSRPKIRSMRTETTWIVSSACSEAISDGARHHSQGLNQIFRKKRG